MLTNKQVRKVRNAARAIFYKTQHWSCHAVRRSAGYHVRFKYADFYDQTRAGCWPGLGIDDMNKKEREHRIMLLLFFAETKGKL